MKCPWREYVHVQQGGMGHVYRDVKWDECYKEECPFWVHQVKYKSGNVEEYCKRTKDDPT